MGVRISSYRSAALLLAYALAAAAPSKAAAAAAVMSDVTVSPAFFNPSLGQKESVRLQVGRPGTLTVKILDRDRFPIRTIQPIAVEAGPVTAIWDGKDDRGEVVPDEAYELRLEFSDGKTSEIYDPAEHFHPVQEDAKVNFYSREDGVLSYSLAWPARVHAQAGQAHKDVHQGEGKGPVLKTLIDDSPRVAGQVVEKWNGLDEGRTIYVPDLPDFVVAVFATSLPPASMITVGNRQRTFFAYAQERRPAEATKPRSLGVAAPHHLNLTAFEDQTPSLALKSTATWNEAKRAWDATTPLSVQVSPSGDSTPYFLGQPTSLVVFVDEKEVLRVEKPVSPVSVKLEATDLPSGSHRVTFNWSSSLGPVAVNAMSISVQAEAHQNGGGR